MYRVFEFQTRRKMVDFDQLLSQLDSKITELVNSNAKREDAQKAIEPILQKIGTLGKDPSIAPRWDASRKEKV